MTYKVESTEKLTNTASETETKALLYLMNFHADNNDIKFFVIDFFNDVTGTDNFAAKLWDVQSKAGNNVSPKKVGRNLVTLYKNFLSEFDFYHYILFMGTPSNTVRKDNSKMSFGIENITSEALQKIKLGLKDEATHITYIPDEKITEQSIDDFLKLVYFVIDNKKPCDYIRPIIKVKPDLIPDDETLTGIFNEIRDKQSSKKNGKSVEGITISVPHEALNYFRHLEAEEIKLLVLSRVINTNPMEQKPPVSFMPILSCIPPEQKKDCIENCRIALSRALFDKNSIDIFWGILSEIISIIKLYPTYDINQIYSSMDQELVAKCKTFDIISLKFFIANIKDGVAL